MHKRIVFLDIDGVLVHRESFERLGSFDHFDPRAVELLRKVITSNNAEIVVSSTWRNAPDWREHICEMFAEAGWHNPPIIGRTPDFSDSIRGEEIKAWLDENPTESFIIIDDEEDMLEEQLPSLILCGWESGFTETQTQQISAMWKNAA